MEWTCAKSCAEREKSSNHNEIEGIALPTPILKLGLFCILMLLLVFLLTYSIINYIPYQKDYLKPIHRYHLKIVICYFYLIYHFQSPPIYPFLYTALAVWHKAIAYSLLLEKWTFSSWKCNYSVILDPKLIIPFDNRAIIERKLFLLQSNIKKKAK